MEKGFESWLRNQMISPKEQLPVCGPKKFLVFDQSNNRTTLIYSSNPIPSHTPKLQKPVINPENKNFCFQKHENTQFLFSNPFLDNHNDSRSEMREDTEELNALLYSDNGDETYYSEEDEERSTAHSPFTTPFHQEVACSSQPLKRRKLENGGFDAFSLEDTASSCVNCYDDAGGVESESGKRLRKTISVLEDLIPGGKNGKDVMMILDEAVDYLTILKVKAKALGLGSL